MTPFCSFITPTIGRPEIRDTLHSIETQTDTDIESIVVADGFPFELSLLPDSRFASASSDVHLGSAGMLRNLGIEFAQGEWIGFVDDDDILTPNYTKFLRDHASEHPEADVIVFRMNDPILGILPDPANPLIKWGHVGISFAVKAKYFKNGIVSFIQEDISNPGPDTNEDIALLRDLIAAECRIFLSPHLTYVCQPREKERLVGPQ